MKRNHQSQSKNKNKNRMKTGIRDKQSVGPFESGSGRGRFSQNSTGSHSKGQLPGEARQRDPQSQRTLEPIQALPLIYTIEIENPITHRVKVSLKGKVEPGMKSLVGFFPVSPSSHAFYCGQYGPTQFLPSPVCRFQAQTALGEPLYFREVSPGRYQVRLSTSALEEELKSHEFVMSYVTYAHGRIPWTSDVRECGAYLSGPTFLMGLEGWEQRRVEVEVRFPPLWSKLSWGLRDISPRREIFLYEAENFDQLLKAPLIIGCHESDGFMLDVSGGPEAGGSRKVAHEICWRGSILPQFQQLPIKIDLQKVLEALNSFFPAELPRPDFHFYFFFDEGGPREETERMDLAFPQSVVLCEREANLLSPQGYARWLQRVAEAYLHALWQGWGVKRFDHLSVFLGKWSLWESGIRGRDHFLRDLERALRKFLSWPGRRERTWEEGLVSSTERSPYGPDFAINYGIPFRDHGKLIMLALLVFLQESGRDWKAFLGEVIRKAATGKDRRGEIGLEKGEGGQADLDLPQGFTAFSSVDQVELEKWLGAQRVDLLERMIRTTEDVNWGKILESIGLGLVWRKSNQAYWGIHWRQAREGGLWVDRVEVQSPAGKAGINAGDEILAVDQHRVHRGNVEAILATLPLGQRHSFLLARQERVVTLEVLAEKRPGPVLQGLQVLDERKWGEFLSWM